MNDVAMLTPQSTPKKETLTDIDSSKAFKIKTLSSKAFNDKDLSCKAQCQMGPTRSCFTKM